MISLPLLHYITLDMVHCTLLFVICTQLILYHIQDTLKAQVQYSEKQKYEHQATRTTSNNKTSSVDTA